MRKIIFFALVLILSVSCRNNSGNVNAGAKQFEMSGVWKGLLPAADCSGIDYILSLQPDGSYKMTITHIDGEGDGIDIVFFSQGKVVRVSEDDVLYLRLLPPPGNDTVYFKVVDSNILRLVDKHLQEPQNPQLYNIVKE